MVFYLYFTTKTRIKKDTQNYKHNYEQTKSETPFYISTVYIVEYYMYVHIFIRHESLKKKKKITIK